MISDCVKMEKYINITENPDWETVAGELDTVFLDDDSDNWDKKQWVIYIAYNAYRFYCNKTDFDVISKGIYFWHEDDGLKESTITNYQLLIYKKEIVLLDFYYFIEKHFSLKTMQSIGY